ncbi:MAG: hypothetical protein V4736_07495 [Bdellovibrionota bacterium]
MPKKINEMIDEVETLSTKKIAEGFFEKLRNYEKADFSALNSLIEGLTILMGEIGTTDGELNDTGILIDDLLGLVNDRRIKEGAKLTKGKNSK